MSWHILHILLEWSRNKLVCVHIVLKIFSYSDRNTDLDFHHAEYD